MLAKLHAQIGHVIAQDVKEPQMPIWHLLRSTDKGLRLWGFKWAIGYIAKN